MLRLSVVIAVVGCLGASVVASADTIPPPKAGWWSKVHSGDSYTLRFSGKMSMTIKTTVLSRKGPMLTVMRTMRANGVAPKVDTLTLDARTATVFRQGTAKNLKDTTTRKLGRQSHSITGLGFYINRYQMEMKVSGAVIKVRVWHSPDLSPFFWAGRVLFDALKTPMGLRVEMVALKRGSAAKNQP